MSHKMWQRRLGRFVFKIRARNTKFPCSFQPPPPPATKTNRNTRIQWEWIITAHKIPRISYTNKNNNRQSWVSCGSINETKSKQKKKREKPKRKTFCAQGEIEIGGHMSVHVNDTFENRTHNENTTEAKRRREWKKERKRRFSHCTV